MVDKIKELKAEIIKDLEKIRQECHWEDDTWRKIAKLQEKYK